MLKDLARLRDHYYSIYLAKLEAKVEQQRKELKAKEEKHKKLLVEAEAKKVSVIEHAFYSDSFYLVVLIFEAEARVCHFSKILLITVGELLRLSLLLIL